MVAPDAGIEPEDEPLGGGAGDQSADTERAGTPGPGTAGADDNTGGTDNGGVSDSAGSGAPEIGEDEELAARLEVDPERGDVKG